MNIGFDLDKVFINYPPFVPDSLIDRIYKKKGNGILLYRIPSRPEQILRIVSHHPILRRPIKANVTFLKKLSKNKEHKYYLISSRFSFLKNRTHKLMEQHEFGKLFDMMFFNFQDKQPHIFKHEIINRQNIHRYVDDDLQLLKFLAKKNPKRIFFWLNKKINKKLQVNLTAITDMTRMFK